MRASENATSSRYASSPAAASAMSGLWNAPDVAKRDERFPASAHAASARSTAAGVPATTICPGQLKFAGTSRCV